MPRYRWIEIVGWEKFQHYRDRDPIWIKTYVALLANPKYRELPRIARSTLLDLWLLYAWSGGEVPKNARELSRILGASVTDSNLERLNHAGFIRFRASKPASTALALARSREEEEELRKKKKERDRSRDQNPDPLDGDGPKLLDFREYVEKLTKEAT